MINATPNAIPLPKPGLNPGGPRSASRDVRFAAEIDGADAVSAVDLSEKSLSEAKLPGLSERDAFLSALKLALKQNKAQPFVNPVKRALQYTVSIPFALIYLPVAVFKDYRVLYPPTTLRYFARSPQMLFDAPQQQKKTGFISQQIWALPDSLMNEGKVNEAMAAFEEGFDQYPTESGWAYLALAEFCTGILKMDNRPFDNENDHYYNRYSPDTKVKIRASGVDFGAVGLEACRRGYLVFKAGTSADSAKALHKMAELYTLLGDKARAAAYQELAG